MASFMYVRRHTEDASHIHTLFRLDKYMAQPARYQDLARLPLRKHFMYRMPCRHTNIYYKV